MIFLTIGTLDPFDRLVKTVDDLVGQKRIEQEVIAQIGHGAYQPKHLKSYPVLEKGEYDMYMDQSSFIISHAGMGSIITAITLKKPMIIMPRLAKYGEHVNDHQLDTACKFEEEGVVLVANDEHEMLDKIERIAQFKPATRQDRSKGLVERITHFLDEV